MTPPIKRRQRQRDRRREALRLEAGIPPEPAKEGPEPTRDETRPSSLYWSTLSPEARKLAIERGQSATYERFENIAIDLMAIRSRFPIPAEMKAYQVYSAFRIIENPNAEVKDKIAASRLLATMEAMNQRDEQGPDQVGVSVTIDGAQVPAFDLLDHMRRSFDYANYDDRPFKPAIGGPDDYAD